MPSKEQQLNYLEKFRHRVPAEKPLLPPAQYLYPIFDQKGADPVTILQAHGINPNRSKPIFTSKSYAGPEKGGMFLSHISKFFINPEDRSALVTVSWKLWHEVTQTTQPDPLLEPTQIDQIYSRNFPSTKELKQYISFLRS